MNHQRYAKIYADEAVPDESLKLEHNPGQAFLLAMIKAADMPSLEGEGKVNIILHVVLSAIMWLFSVIIQLLLLFLIFAYPVEQSEDPWEEHLHRETLALQSALAQRPPRQLILRDPFEYRAHTLCNHDHTVMFSQSLLIFVWVTKMLPYLWKNGFCLSVIISLPWASDANPLCYEADDKSFVVTHLRRRIRIAIVVLVLFPQFVVDLVILYVGAKFLFYCPSLLTLITKSLCFFFLTQIDDVIYEGLGSRAMKKVISKSTFQWHKKGQSPQWDLWGSSTVRLLIALAVTLYYTRVFHGDIQVFRALCYEYKTIFAQSCENCGMDFFGLHLELS